MRVPRLSRVLTLKHDFLSCDNFPLKNIWNLWKVVLQFPNVPDGNKCSISSNLIIEIIIDFRSHFLRLSQSPSLLVCRSGRGTALSVTRFAADNIKIF